MSNHLAIATVTATLFNVLTAGKEDAGTSITTKPPDKAREDSNGAQVNLFLYHTEIDAAWRNMELPRKVKPGESGHPPLPLVLYYLVTAYGEADDEIDAHRILGRAMANLHDRPVLGRGELEGADASLAASDLHEQVERVRVTPEPLTLDDMYKLWSSFQTQYRPSAAYQVSVVLIESGRPVKTPLPVLTRGEEDRGPTAQGNLSPPFPTLFAVTPPDGRPAALLGDVLAIDGFRLEGDTVAVHLLHPRAGGPIVLEAEAGATGTRVEVTLPPLPPPGNPDWMAGVYALSLVVRRAGEPDRTTNALPVALAPRIAAVAPNPADLAVDPELQVTCEPAVLPAQAARLLLGDRSIEPAPFAAPSTTLDFPLAGSAPGEHFVRLRVDGVDSPLIDHTQTPPVFDPGQEVTLT